MRVVLAMLLTMVLVGLVIAQQTQPMPDPTLQIDPNDRAALDSQLLNMQLSSTKDWALRLLAENRKLKEENASLKEQLSKLVPKPTTK